MQVCTSPKQEALLGQAIWVRRIIYMETKKWKFIILQKSNQENIEQLLNNIKLQITKMAYQMKKDTNLKVLKNSKKRKIEPTVLESMRKELKFDGGK